MRLELALVNLDARDAPSGAISRAQPRRGTSGLASLARLRRLRIVRTRCDSSWTVEGISAGRKMVDPALPRKAADFPRAGAWKASSNSGNVCLGRLLSNVGASDLLLPGTGVGPELREVEECCDTLRGVISFFASTVIPVGSQRTLGFPPHSATIVHSPPPSWGRSGYAPSPWPVEPRASRGYKYSPFEGVRRPKNPRPSTTRTETSD